ncbi:MAG: DMT family transporter [Chromatiales bacterium]|nr:DMT family transporter [Chromatiales bacterium]
MTTRSTFIRLVLAALFWGGTCVAGRGISQDIGPYSAAFIRFLLSSLILLPLLVREQSRLPILTRRQLMAVVLLGLTGVFAYNVFFFSGLETVEAGRAAVIIAANPVFIALFAFLLFGEALTPLKVLGIVCSVFGAVVVISRGDPQLILQGGVGIGEIYLIGCVISWVSYTLIGKRVMSGLSPLTAVTYSAVAGTLMLLPPAVVEGVLTNGSVFDLKVFGALGYLAIFGTVLGFVWFYQGVKEIGPARAGVFINLVPVSGVLFGVVILGERLSWSLLFGGVLVLLGLVLTNRQPVKA